MMMVNSYWYRMRTQKNIVTDIDILGDIARNNVKRWNDMLEKIVNLI